MSIPAISMEMATALVGSLPSLAPQQTGASIRVLEQDLMSKLRSMPSHQLREHGYLGTIIDPPCYLRLRIRNHPGLIKLHLPAIQ